MNLIKLLKVLGVGYVAGQVVASKYGNKEISKQLSESRNEWSKKIQTLFDHLMNVNRDFFSDMKNYDYQRSADDMKNWAQEQYSSIENQIASIKEKGEDYINSPEVQKTIAKLQDQVASVKSKSAKIANDFDLNEKFENVSSSLKKFGQNVVKKADNIKDVASEKIDDAKSESKKFVDKAERKFDQLKQDASEKFEDVKEKAADKVQDVKHDAKHLANKAQSKVEDVADNTKKIANQASNKVENKANQLKSDAKKVARDVSDEYEYDMDSKPHGNIQIEFKNNKNS